MCVCVCVETEAKQQHIRSNRTIWYEKANFKWCVHEWANVCMRMCYAVDAKVFASRTGRTFASARVLFVGDLHCVNAYVCIRCTQLWSNQSSHVSIECNYFISVKWLTNINNTCTMYTYMKYIHTYHHNNCMQYVCTHTHTHSRCCYYFHLIVVVGWFVEITGMARPPLLYSTAHSHSSF